LTKSTKYAVAVMAEWGLGKWGSGGISTKTLKPQHPITPKPYYPTTDH